MIRPALRALSVCSAVTHRLLHIATGFVVVLALLLAGAAWRLAQGPIEIGWLADRMNAMASDESAPVRAKFHSVSLTWEGFQSGVDYPIDLHVTGVVLTDPMNRTLAEAPDAHVTFSLASLLVGRIVPRTVEVDHARIAITRAANGSVGLNGGETEAPGAAAEPVDLNALRAQLLRPAGSDRGGNQGLLEQLVRVHFRDATVTFQDLASGRKAVSAGMNLDLRRLRGGHVGGSLDAPIAVRGQTLTLTANADLVPGGDTAVRVVTTPFRPAAMQDVPAAVAAIDLPLSIDAAVTLDKDFRPRVDTLALHMGAGSIAMGEGHFPLRRGEIALSGNPAHVTVSTAWFDVSRSADMPPELVTAGGEVSLSGERVVASLTLGLSHIDMADLPRLWPAGVGGGSRPWITQNILGGIINTGTGSFVIESDQSLHNIVLTKATAALDGTGGAFTWIDDVPPVEQAEVHLRLLDPDSLEIAMPSARQRIRGGGTDLTIKDGRMRITGLSQHDQFATIRTAAEGPVTSVLSLLKEPRLHLLSVHPIGLKPTVGDTSAVLDFQFPLENKLQMDDVAIHAETHLRHARIPDAVAGRDLEDGAFDSSVDKMGLTTKGRGILAGIPVTLSGMMDFAAGPADQIVRKVDVAGQPSAAQLDAAGLRVSDVVDGTLPLQAGFIERRNGNDSVALSGDLTAASLSVAPLAWVKPAGTTASATAVLMLNRDRMTKIDRIAVRGDGLQMDGSVDCSGGQPRSVQLDFFRLGRTEGQGSAVLGSAALGRPVAITLRGSQIDLAPKLAEKSPPEGAPVPPPATTPSWTLDARFDRVLLANNEKAGDFAAVGKGDGETIRTLDASGSFGDASGFTVRIDAPSAKRHLHVEAGNAGRFLSAMDTTRRMEDGRLVLDGDFETAVGYHPLGGTMNITDVRVRNSPVLGKLLQAITLYGLVDALRGPGMMFSHVTVPFRYEGARIRLAQARAFNASLGLTAAGTLDLATQRVAVNGTIVPAYFFNTLLGRLPLVGRLFSPEVGGGVFAVRYGMDGPIEDPGISVNPISGLTPGFMREIFGVFGKAPSPGMP